MNETQYFLSRLRVLGYTDADIKRALALPARDPAVWRWRTGRQTMRRSTFIKLRDALRVKIETQ